MIHTAMRVSLSNVWAAEDSFDLWISCHGYESRSVMHLSLPPFSARRKLSVGFEFPGKDSVVGERLARDRVRLKQAGFDVAVMSDGEFDSLIRDELREAGVGRRLRVMADISSMNRTRIASVVLACASEKLAGGCDLDLLYFPGTFATHKHEYEPLESFGPVHEEIAGWPDESYSPMAIVIGLGTEPRRAEGLVETLEPDILSVFIPSGDEDEYRSEIEIENRRVLEVGGLPILYTLRDPPATYKMLLANISQLCERARVVVVPLGPKMFAALAMVAALELGPHVGVWKASAGRGVQTIDVQGNAPPVVARVAFVRDTSTKLG